MGNKILVEICLISARGLRVGSASSLLKHQWYAVGWIDEEDKYCTKIDASRSNNPLWRTKFTTLLEQDRQDSKSSLHIEVYSREPFFLRKKLHGTATVSLKEFLVKYNNQESSVVEETGSYQLRKEKSSKPLGFVDVSIRLSAENDGREGYTTGDIGGVMLSNNNSLGQDYNMAGSSPMPYPQMQQQPYYPPPPMQQSYYPPPPMQPPGPPPTLNKGYIPSYMPRAENVVNIPSLSSLSGGMGRGVSSLSGGAGRGYAGPGAGLASRMGVVGGGVVGAAAAYYGSELLSGGFDLPSLPSVSLPNVSLPNISIPNGSISIDPPF